MVRYYGRARQITGTVFTNQPGLKQAGCPGTVGKRGTIVRFLGRRVNCNLKTCGLPMSGLRCKYGVRQALGDMNWKDVKYSNNPAIPNYCRQVVNKKNGVHCRWPQPKNRQLAGGVGNIWTPRRNHCEKTCSLGWEEKYMNEHPDGPPVLTLQEEIEQHWNRGGIIALRGLMTPFDQPTPPPARGWTLYAEDASSNISLNILQQHAYVNGIADMYGGGSIIKWGAGILYNTWNREKPLRIDCSWPFSATIDIASALAVPVPKGPCTPLSGPIAKSCKCTCINAIGGLVPAPAPSPPALTLGVRKDSNGNIVTACTCGGGVPTSNPSNIVMEPEPNPNDGDGKAAAIWRDKLIQFYKNRRESGGGMGIPARNYNYMGNMCCFTYVENMMKTRNVLFPWLMGKGAVDMGTCLNWWVDAAGQFHMHPEDINNEAECTSRLIPGTQYHCCQWGAVNSLMSFGVYNEAAYTGDQSQQQAAYFHARTVGDDNYKKMPPKSVVDAFENLRVAANHAAGFTKYPKLLWVTIDNIVGANAAVGDAPPKGFLPPSCSDLGECLAGVKPFNGVPNTKILWDKLKDLEFIVWPYTAICRAYPNSPYCKR